MSPGSALGPCAQQLDERQPMTHHACGLDFGTSNSTVGWSRRGQPAHQSALLPLEDGRPTLPSVIFFHSDDPLVSYGRAALADYLAGHEGRLMRSLKSLLGTSMMDDSTEVMGQPMPFRTLLARFIAELKQRAETAADIARAAGFEHIAFQYEPIAAAFDYESTIAREELVLIADIGGGTSDFSLVRLSPERAKRLDRRDDILANGGVHIGGSDFDKALSLASVMPLLGLGSQLANGKAMPSGQYFDLAGWHTINLAYTRKAWTHVMDNYREAGDKASLDRLVRLIKQRDGHWLAMQVEDAKIALSDAPLAEMDLQRLGPDVALTIHRATFDNAIGKLVAKTEKTVTDLLRTAGIAADAVDTVFFTGGSSSVPLLRDRIAAQVPGARRVEGDLFGSIGAGLALDAARKFG
jgi:hypothetical chaperone protein